MNTQPKLKRCKACGEEFQPFNTLAKACSVACSLRLVEEKKARDNQRANNKAKKALRESDRGWWLKAAQAEFNKWVRLRDKDLPCISCGKPATDKQAFTGGYWDCGHYRSTGAAPELRFEPLNAAKQCKQCNRDLSGNVVEYRIRLLNRIGAEKLEWLEGPHDPKHYTIEDLKEIRAHYRGLIKQMEAV